MAISTKSVVKNAQEAFAEMKRLRQNQTSGIEVNNFFVKGCFELD